MMLHLSTQYAVEHDCKYRAVAPKLVPHPSMAAEKSTLASDRRGLRRSRSPAGGLRRADLDRVRSIGGLPRRLSREPPASRLRPR